MRAGTVLAFAVIARACAVSVPSACAYDSENASREEVDCDGVVLSVAMPQHCVWSRMEMSLSAESPPELAPPQSPRPKDFDWRGKLSVSGWSGNRRLDELQGVGYVQALNHFSYKWSDSASLIAEGYWDREEAPGSDQDSSRVRIREAYLRLRDDKLSLSIGPQIISWGRADVINPTDNVSARDYTLLVNSDSEQKLGVTTANLVYRSGSLTLQALAQGPFRADRVPLPQLDGTYYVSDEPDRDLVSYGAKVDWSGNAASWSLSVLSGAMKRPNLRLSPSRIGQGILDLNYPDATIYGGDVEWLSGKLIVRGEAAYTDVEDSGSDALSSRESSFLGVLGIERDFGSASGFVQAIYRRSFDYFSLNRIADPAIRGLAIANAALNEETRQTLTGVAGGLSLNTSDLVWQASADFLYVAATDEWVIRPRLSYRWTDHITLWVGGDYIEGLPFGTVGRLSDNKSVYAGVALTLWRD